MGRTTKSDPTPGEATQSVVTLSSFRFEIDEAAAQRALALARQYRQERAVEKKIELPKK